MKVLIIPSWYGTEENQIRGIFFRELAESLVHQGADVAVLHFDIRHDVKKGGIEYKIQQGVHQYVYRQINFTPRSASGVELQKKIKTRYICRYIEETFGRPNIIHLESCSSVGAALRAREIFDVPLVYTEHLSNTLTKGQRGYYANRFRKATQQADGCIAISSVFRKKLYETGACRVDTIPNGICIKSHNRSLNTDTFNVKALGSLRGIKGYDTLIKAFRKFSLDKADVRLFIGGSGDNYKQLSDMIAELCLENKAFLIGQVERKDVERFYSDCSVFVCSSRMETFSVVTAEALGCGVPVISTRCGGPEDMINESNGILVDTDNADAMAEALEKMYKNMDKYDRTAISEEAQNRYDRFKVADMHLKYYKEIIDEFNKG